MGKCFKLHHRSYCPQFFLGPFSEPWLPPPHPHRALGFLLEIALVKVMFPHFWEAVDALGHFIFFAAFCFSLLSFNTFQIYNLDRKWNP